jgi:hypothetical protein
MSEQHTSKGLGHTGEDGGETTGGAGGPLSQTELKGGEVPAMDKHQAGGRRRRRTRRPKKGTKRRGGQQSKRSGRRRHRQSKRGGGQQSKQQHQHQQ